MGILVDVHCHLDHVAFKDDLDKVIERAKKAGMKAIITNGLNPETNRISLKLAEKYEIVKAALGIYPIDALQKEAESGEYPTTKEGFDVDEEIAFIRKNNDKIVAVGECGLDFKSSEHKEKQIEVFKKMIALSVELEKPIIVHSRKAEQECIETLEQFKTKKIVMHCFSGKVSLVKRVRDNGWFFSVPANIVFSQQFQRLVEEIPLSQLLTETDAPLLSPFRGERNEPAFIAETIKKIAEIKNMDATEVENVIYNNYQRLFL